MDQLNGMEWNGPAYIIGVFVTIYDIQDRQPGSYVARLGPTYTHQAFMGILSYIAIACRTFLPGLRPLLEVDELVSRTIATLLRAGLDLCQLPRI